MAGEENNPGFKVTDRRSSAQQDTQPAEPKPEQAAAEQQPVTPPEPAQAAPAEAARPAAAETARPASAEASKPDSAEAPVQGLGWEMKQERKQPAALPPIDFTTFCLSLAASATMHLGLTPYPEGAKAEKNLPLAKQTIDILAMLEEKTRGNLTPDESKLIATVLYDLRMRFVEARR